MSIVWEEIARIVADRERQYDALVADIYFMAVLSGDLETAQQIWEEAWNSGKNYLVAFLICAEMQLDRVQ